MHRSAPFQNGTAMKSSNSMPHEFQNTRHQASSIALFGSLFVMAATEMDRHPLRAQQPTKQNASTAETPRLALVIGIAKYPNLGASEQLKGCGNDVVAIRRLLIERFRFKENNIKTLVDHQATSGAIRAAMSDLIAQVKALPADGPIAQVVFHVSGHGSQIPDQPFGDPDHDEEDGLDETIVPYDATKQGGKEDIRDDEINAFVNQICADNKAQDPGRARHLSFRHRRTRRDTVSATFSPRSRSQQVPRGCAAPVTKKLPPGAVFLERLPIV